MNRVPIEAQEDGFRLPNRKPWMLLVVLLVFVIAVIVFLRGKARHGAVPAEQAVSPVEQQVGTVPVTGGTEPVPVPVLVPTQEVQKAGQAVSNTAVAAEATLPALLAEAKALEEKDDLAGARGKWREVLRVSRDARLIADAEDKIGRFNVAMALTPRPMPEKVDYVVHAGDSIEKIARKHGTTVDLIQEGNQLKNAGLIKAGDRLLVLTGKMSLEVSKGRNDLVVRLNNTFFKRYRVGTGKYSKTPVGTFVIVDRQKEPVWWRPDGKQIPFGDKENILGTRWMSIKATGSTADIKGYGIHGTWDETSIGKSESAGCVRMKNSDVEELFKLVPANTPVTITE